MDVRRALPRIPPIETTESSKVRQQEAEPKKTAVLRQEIKRVVICRLKPIARFKRPV